MSHVNIHKADAVRLFIKRHADVGVRSTGASVVEISDDLYNITGSTKDPRKVREHKGKDWMELLKTVAHLVDASCYVINAKPTKASTHPGFNVGGHMTLNPDGEVEIGGISYLMPLCKWHNNPARNGVAFEHGKTTMLELTGYMEGETVATFSMRLSSPESHSLLYFDKASQSWEFLKLSDEQAQGLKPKLILGVGISDEPIGGYALYERRDGLYYTVDFSF